jgi:hypothetical protein
VSFDPAGWTSAADHAALLWRGVEAQHIVATMRLVDTLDEQAVLEVLLEASKPALQRSARSGHYLLTTPFRYRSPIDSRFRRAGAPGVWYGAETLHAAAAEVAWWRWRFLSASDGLRDQVLLTEHSFFQARVQGLAIDLSHAPWSERSSDWTNDSDYSATQALAGLAADHGVQWIRHASVRLQGGLCGAVLDARALSWPDPPQQQTWHCKTTLASVLLQHDADRFAWTY